MDYKQNTEIRELLNTLPKEVLIMELAVYISKDVGYDYPSVKDKVQSIIDAWEKIDSEN
ncbi:hypothetical protein LSPCS325_16150 [Lysinibacillus sp. CTST325]